MLVRSRRGSVGRDTGTDPRRARAPHGRRPTVGLAALALALATAAGCAERGLVARPSSPPGSGTWVAAWVAGVLAAAVGGVLLTLPAWRAKRGARLATALFTAQAGAAALVGSVLTAVAIRTWQLIGRPADAAPATDLLRLSRVDGDARYYALMVTAVAVVTVLVVALTSAAARLAASEDPFERTVACALLAIEIGGSGVAIVSLVLGANGLPFLVPALAFPVLVASFIACWPRVPRRSRA